MLMLGVPLYRLPRELVQAEIDAIVSLGVELRLNARIGTPGLTLDDLRAQGYAAIFLGAGLQGSRKLDLPGSDLEGVVHGLEFLKLVNLGENVNVGPRVLVIGGGNVAFDVARTALRTADEEAEDFRVTADVARTAVRRAGVSEVRVACLESREEMPADAIEIEEGEHEGLILHPSLGPKAVVGNGRVQGVEFVKCLSVFDSERRFSPKFDESHREILEADTVIMAIGQVAELNFLTPEDGVAVTSRGLIEADPETLQTSRPDVFAGGDLVLGPRLFIDAIANGQQAARSIHDYLRRTTTTVHVRHEWSPARYTMGQDWEIASRRLPPSRAPRPSELPEAAGRLVEENYPEAQARHRLQRVRGRLPHRLPAPGGALRRRPRHPAPGPRPEPAGNRARPARRLRAGRAGPRRWRDAEGRDRLHPLLDVRLALPHRRVHDAAVPLPPRAGGGRPAEPASAILSGWERS
jgi:thioredoxin reductase